MPVGRVLTIVDAGSAAQEAMKGAAGIALGIREVKQTTKEVGRGFGIKEAYVYLSILQ